MRTLPALALTIAFSGCGPESRPPTSPESPPTFTVSPHVQWSGGRVTLSSRLFAQHATLPSIRVADVPVLASRVDDSTVTVPVPVVPSQRVAITVIDQFAGYVADSLDIRGLRTSSYPLYAPINLVGIPVILDFPTGPVAIGSYPLGGTGIYGGLATLNLRQGTVDVTQAVSLVRWDLSVGPSYQPSHFFALDSTGQPGEWSLLPLTYVGPVAVMSSRFTVQLNPSTWLAAFNHFTIIHRTGQPDVTVVLEDPSRPRLSIAADRAIMSAGNGAPVFAVSTGDVAYNLPVHEVDAATFSPDGQRLYVAGRPGGGAAQLLFAFRASDGLPEAVADTLEDRNSLNALLVSNLTLNPSGSLLFLTGEVDARLIVWVYDATTLERVGELSTNAAFPCYCDVHNLNLASVFDQDRATFVVLQPGIPTHIWQFDLVPEALAARAPS